MVCGQPDIVNACPEHPASGEGTVQAFIRRRRNGCEGSLGEVTEVGLVRPRAYPSSLKIGFTVSPLSESRAASLICANG